MVFTPVSNHTKFHIIACHKLYYSQHKIVKLCEVSRRCVVTTVENWKETANVIDRPDYFS